MTLSLRSLRDPILVAIGLVALWQVLHHIAGDSAVTAPAPTLSHLWEMIGQARFLPHLRETGLAFLQALAISCVGGVLIGIVLGGHRLTGEVAEPILVGLYSVPKITLYPVILLLFGLGMCRPSGVNSSPQANSAPSRPPRAANSHSASVGSSLPAHLA